MNSLSSAVIIVFAVVLTVVVGDQTSIRIGKKLRNGEELDEDFSTVVTLFHNCKNGTFGTTLVIALLPPKNPNTDVRLYFANDTKSLLEVHLKGSRVIGYQYETPHGPRNQIIGEDVIQNKESSSLMAIVPSSWIPDNAHSVNAAVFGTEIYNYYGIYNFDLSIEDTMVIENFKKVKCKQEDALNSS